MGIRIETIPQAREVVAKIHGVCQNGPFFSLSIEPKGTYTVSCSKNGVAADTLCIVFEHGSCPQGIDRTQLLKEIAPQLDRV